MYADAPGCYVRGTRVRKVNTLPGDTHADGSEGTVLGSHGPGRWYGEPVYGYWVRWDGEDQPCFVMDRKIERIA